MESTLCQQLAQDVWSWWIECCQHWDCVALVQQRNCNLAYNGYTTGTGGCVKNILQQQTKSRWLFGLLERLLQSGKNKQRLLFYAQWHHRLTWLHHKCYMSNSLGTKEGKKECEKISMVLHKPFCPLPSAAAPLQFLKELKHTAEAAGTNI